MSIEDDFHNLKNEYGEILTESSNLTLSAIDDGMRKFIALESKDSKTLNDAFQIFYKAS